MLLIKQIWPGESIMLYQHGRLNEHIWRKEPIMPKERIIVSTGLGR